jgi:hypothetical protein
VLLKKTMVISFEDFLKIEIQLRRGLFGIQSMNSTVKKAGTAPPVSPFDAHPEKHIIALQFKIWGSL